MRSLAFVDFFRGGQSSLRFGHLVFAAICASACGAEAPLSGDTEGEPSADVQSEVSVAARRNPLTDYETPLPHTTQPQLPAMSGRCSSIT